MLASKITLPIPITNTKYTYHLVNAHLLYAKFGLRDILDYSLKNCINAKIIPLTRFYYKHFVHKKRIIAMCFIEVDDLALNGQVMPVIPRKLALVLLATNK